MEFKVGNKVEYQGPIKKLVGENAVIIKLCNVSSQCRLIKFTGGGIYYAYTRYLIDINEKGQQLVFEFYRKLITN